MKRNIFPHIVQWPHGIERTREAHTKEILTPLTAKLIKKICPQFKAKIHTMGA